ncbi:hypothetical protein F4555_000425 [Mobiluncus mulieris]|uniref:Uncharacterized protein n=1 Tax=Mobiluncus mulieris TaxID=2052 RepID=A0A8G2HRH2_9ACTO|nr:hypothetical protein [Mobiluncus mulieris]STO15704.1 Uncharacterised protein [Mobiluncus mulieris]
MGLLVDPFSNCSYLILISSLSRNSWLPGISFTSPWGLVIEKTLVSWS